MPAKADLQRLRSLRDKKQRETLGFFVVESEKVVAELLAASFPFVEIYATERWSGWASSSDVGGAPPPRETIAHSTLPSGVRAPRPQPDTKPQLTVVRLTEAEMARASHLPTPSSVLAVGSLTRRPLAVGDLSRGLTLVLDGVQDAGNVGTLIRIADWFALDRVVLSPDCADLFSQKVINASMGSFARVRVHTAELAPALSELPPATPVLGCDLTGDSVHDLKPLRDAVLVIGNEGRGLSPAVAAKITRRVTIPKFGAAESLNAAVAAAIVCDNLRRAAG